MGFEILMYLGVNVNIARYGNDDIEDLGNVEFGIIDLCGLL